MKSIPLRAIFSLVSALAIAALVVGWRTAGRPMPGVASASASIGAGFFLAGGTESDGVKLEGVDEFSLGETPQALTVTPMVTVDPRGGFLVADPREAQVRRYDPRGELLWHRGRKGAGPGEYVSPTAAVRLARGEVVAVDRTGRLTTYDSEGASVLRTDETTLNHVEELVPLGDSLLLVGGVRNGDHNGPRLHLWDLRTHTLGAGFFSPLPNAANRTAAFVAGWTKASVRADSFAAVFATSDTVFIYTPDLRLHQKIPLPSRHFRRGPRGEPAATSDPAVQARWMSQFDFVEAVYWLADGTFLVTYQSVDPERALERRRHLVHMDRSGRLLFESRNGPRLLEVDLVRRLLYFVHPRAEVPNRWTVARLR